MAYLIAIFRAATSLAPLILMSWDDDRSVNLLPTEEDEALLLLLLLLLLSVFVSATVVWISNNKAEALSGRKEEKKQFK